MLTQNPDERTASRLSFGYRPTAAYVICHEIDHFSREKSSFSIEEPSFNIEE